MCNLINTHTHTHTHTHTYDSNCLRFREVFVIDGFEVRLLLTECPWDKATREIDGEKPAVITEGSVEPTDDYLYCKVLY